MKSKDQQLLEEAYGQIVEGSEYVPGELGYDAEPNPKFTGNYYWTRGMGGDRYKSFFLNRFIILNPDQTWAEHTDRPVKEGLYVIDRSYLDDVKKVVKKEGKLVLVKSSEIVNIPDEAKQDSRERFSASRDKALKHFFPKE